MCCADETHATFSLSPLERWDVGTHDEGKSSFESIATLFESVGADGCNLDTMTPSYGEGRQWFAASKAAGYPMAFQPEGGVNFWDVAGGSHADIMYEVVTWAEHDENYTWPEGVPMGPTPKLVEQRHQVGPVWIVLQKRNVIVSNDSFCPSPCGLQFQIVDRWQLNKTVPLQTSFVTGAGYVSWENVWGIWWDYFHNDVSLLIVAMIGVTIPPYLGHLTPYDYPLLMSLALFVCLCAFVNCPKGGACAALCRGAPTLVHAIARHAAPHLQQRGRRGVVSLRARSQATWPLAQLIPRCHARVPCLKSNA